MKRRSDSPQPPHRALSAKCAQNILSPPRHPSLTQAHTPNLSVRSRQIIFKQKSQIYLKITLSLCLPGLKPANQVSKQFQAYTIAKVLNILKNQQFLSTKLMFTDITRAHKGTPPPKKKNKQTKQSL